MTQAEKTGVMGQIKIEMKACDDEIHILLGKKSGLLRAMDLLGGSAIHDLSSLIGEPEPTAPMEGDQGWLPEVKGMDIYDAACAFLGAMPKKTARMRDICGFLVEQGISKSAHSAALTLANRMRSKSNNKMKRVALGVYKLYGQD